MNQATAARRHHINELVAQGQQVKINELAKGFGVHPATIYRDLRQLRTTQAPIGEMINRGPAAINYRWQTAVRTVDYTQVNYEFWGKLRRLKAQGYEIGALFASPMVKTIVAAVLGDGPKFRVKSDMPRDPDMPHPIETALNGEFMSANRQLLSALYYDELTLGDVYAAVNPDGSVTPIQPNQISLETDPLVWQQIKRVTITTKSNQSIITDGYTADQRTIQIKRIADKNGQPDTPVNEETFDFPNLIDRIPIVHFAFGREANELYGHPYYEGLLTLFAEYDDTIRKSLDGVKAMGHPVPVIEGAENPDQVIQDNATGTSIWQNADGSESTRDIIEFERLTMLVLGKGASFNFKSPGQFTEDAGRLLEFLFLLMLQHSRVPEWVWGGAIASSKASVDAQTPAWHDTIRGLRAELEVFLLELVTIWLAMSALVDPALTLNEGETIETVWPELSVKDEKLQHQKVLDGYDRGLLTDQTALAEMEIVPSPEAEIKKVEQQQRARQDNFPARVDNELDADPMDNPDDMNEAA